MIIGLRSRLAWRSRTARLAAAGAGIIAVAFVVGAFLVAPLLVDRAVRQYAARMPDRSAQVERISINPFTLTVELHGVDIREPRASAGLTIDRVLANFDFLTLFQHARVLDELSLEKPRLMIDLTRDGDDDAGVGDVLAAVIPSRPFRIDRFAIAEGQLEIAGAASVPETRIALQNVAVSANHLASDSDSPGDYLLTAGDAAGASLRLDGELTLAPLATRGHLSADAIALETLRPWLGARFAAARASGAAGLAAEYSLSREQEAVVIQLNGATASLSEPAFELDSEIAASAAEAGVRANVHMSFNGDVWAVAGDGEFDAANVAIRSAGEELLFASDRVAASGISVQRAGLEVEAPRMSVEALRLQRPRTRIFLGSEEGEAPENGARLDYPLSGLLSFDGSRASAIPVQSVELIDAELDIIDRDFSPPVLLRSTAVNGTVARAAREDEGLLVDLEGDIGEKGAGKITARLAYDGAVAEHDVELVARDIEAAVVSPYFSRLTRREVAAGLLDFDIEYRLQASEFEGNARVAALDLTFADAGDAPGSRWDLAVALLEDESGRLEVTTPLSRSSGEQDVDGMAAAVVSALSELAVRVTSAPFEVLGTLAGREAEGLRSIAFEPGAASPGDASLDALEDLGAALAQRPRLALLIAGRADPELDRDALAAQQIELHVTLATAGPTLVARPQPVDFSSPRAWDVLDEFANERLSEERLATIASYFPLEADGQIVAAERPSYYRALFDALVANEPIPENALNRLGRYRAQSIADALENVGIDPDRTRILETRVTADARERPPPRIAPLPLPSITPEPPPDDAAASPAAGPLAGAQGEDPAQDSPERIAVPLELQALTNLEPDAALQADTGAAAADQNP